MELSLRLADKRFLWSGTMLRANPFSDSSGNLFG